MGFGSRGENAYATDAFDPRWDDQGNGTVGEVGEGSRGSRTWDRRSCQIILYGTFDKENTICDSSVSLACVHIMRLLTHVLQSFLSIGEHTNDEETFQSTTRHILSLIHRKGSLLTLHLLAVGLL